MQTKKQRTVRKRVIFFFIVLIILVSAFILPRIASFVKPLYQLAFNKNIELKRTEDQRVNVLLLGIGGGTHEGPLLTDTMIYASIDPQKQKVTLISIPRDLWIPDKQEKVNAIYANGEAQGQGKGLQEAKQVVSQIVGQQIDYGFRIDFGGFTKVIDILGGVDVNVDRTFDDYAYPISGKETDTCGLQEDQVASLSAQIATDSATTEDSFPCRYEHLHFDKGPIHMGGETALKFVRSRHALGPEGTDFARSKRQEKIITAVKEKIFSAETLLNPVKIANIYTAVQDSIDTDVKEDQYDDFIKLAEKMKNAKMQSAVIDLGSGESKISTLLTVPPISEQYGRQWVVIPTAGASDYSQIHSYVSCMIQFGTSCADATPSPQPTAQTIKK